MLIREGYELCCYISGHYMSGYLHHEVYDINNCIYYYRSARNNPISNIDITLMAGQLFYYKIHEGDIKIIDIDIYGYILKQYRPFSFITNQLWHSSNLDMSSMCDNYYKNEIIPKLRDEKINNLIGI